MTATSAPVSPDARTIWRRGRGPLLALVVVVLAAAVIAVFRSGETGSLDPASPAPHGSMALAELLRDQGVRVGTVTTSAEAADAVGPGTTLLVTRPQAVAPARLAELQRAVAAAGGRLVLLAPDDRSLAATDSGIHVIGSAEAAEREPDCDDPAARRAGSATTGGYLYQTAGNDRAAGCYPADGFPSLAVVTAGDSETVALGTASPFTNERLADHGNAALALQLLGSRPDVAWYLPSPGEAPPAEDEQTLLDLVDDGWRWAALQLAIAAVLTALWRMRRLGPVVTERLPVRIRAAETTEGRSRLYHQAGARDRAAQALRARARTRLAPLVGIARPGDGEALVAAVAGRAGRPPGEVHGLLYGPDPADDRALIRLADDLDALERRLGPGAPAADAAAGPATHPAHDPLTKDSSP